MYVIVPFIYLVVYNDFFVLYSQNCTIIYENDLNHAILSIQYYGLYTDAINL